MLTRLVVNGFKNLDGIDVRLGPFTCVAGPNGVGKSNLFDAIEFLGALAEHPLMDAALAVRGGEARRGDVRSLFRRTGDKTAESMKFLAEMIIPYTGVDTLGQPAKASMTFLRYELELGYRDDPSVRAMGKLEVRRETMVHINRSTAKSQLRFPHKKPWRDSVVRGRRSSDYISTEDKSGEAVISLHADTSGAKGGGKPRRALASSLPRTMLSSVTNAAEHRTLVLARQEMASWTHLQLEPSALRAPDPFTATRSIASNGAHLPATLYDLSLRAERGKKGGAEDLYARVSNRLSELVESVRALTVDVDEKRELLSIVLTDREGTPHLAGALSDGTLRFLALTVMEEDPRSRPLLCLEEPENGMHPSRIPAVIELLDALVVDADSPVNEENPLRQVIVNTHSPSVVGGVVDGDLLLARETRVAVEGKEESRLALSPLSGTWRLKDSADVSPVTRGELLAYLNPFYADEEESEQPKNRRRVRVKERPDLGPFLPFREPETTA